MSVEENARSIDPGFDMMSPDQQNGIKREVEEALKLWDTHGDGKWKAKLLIKGFDCGCKSSIHLDPPSDYDVIATLNLNGDYISDALAAQVGGIGIAPGANINYETGHAIFEATHGTAPKYADLDKVNPGSVILSGEMMLRYMGWGEAADLIIKGMSGAINAKIVTYDFARLMGERDRGQMLTVRRCCNEVYVRYTPFSYPQAFLTSLTSCSTPFSSGATFINSCKACALPPVVSRWLFMDNQRLSGTPASVEPMFALSSIVLLRLPDKPGKRIQASLRQAGQGLQGMESPAAFDG